MRLGRFLDSLGKVQVGLIEGNEVHGLASRDGEKLTLASILEQANPGEYVRKLPKIAPAFQVDQVKWLSPVDQQEVWAAGVTYIRSKSARMEESEAAASCYDRVYVSPRPELFMKATPHRTVGHGGQLRIRKDATWNVPEPELTLVMNSKMTLVGFTIGNDMSSRDIEGENPLYLPQAKVYDQCCGLGPWVTLTEAVANPLDMRVGLTIERAGATVFSGETNVNQMARKYDELIGWLGRDNSFPNGVFLMTGTGVVPDSNFTLNAGDVVSIEIAGLGKLVNTIVQG